MVLWVLSQWKMQKNSLSQIKVLKMWLLCRGTYQKVCSCRWAIWPYRTYLYNCLRWICRYFPKAQANQRDLRAHKRGKTYSGHQNGLWQLHHQNEFKKGFIWKSATFNTRSTWAGRRGRALSNELKENRLDHERRIELDIRTSTSLILARYLIYIFENKHHFLINYQ